MQLFYTQKDPYARKVRAAIIQLGMLDEIKMIEVNPKDLPAEVLEANPLGKLPTLITNDGVGLYDSLVILEYLNGQLESAPIVPLTGATRWLVLRMEVLGDRLVNAIIKRYAIQHHEQAEQNPGDLERYAGLIQRVLRFFDKKIPSSNIHVGSLSLACAIEFLDSPYGVEWKNWREIYPNLAGWFEKISEESCLKETKPIW